MLKKYITFIIYLALLHFSSIHSKENFSNYKNYELTKTKFKLEKVAKELDHPWALTFIDNNHLIVTEKSGGIYKINTSSGEKQAIKHNIQHIGYDGGSVAYSQGGLLDTYFNSADGFIYFTLKSENFYFLRRDCSNRLM